MFSRRRRKRMISVSFIGKLKIRLRQGYPSAKSINIRNQMFILGVDMCFSIPYRT